MTTNLTPEAFGRVLLETGDLDPLYMMLNEAVIGEEPLARFCMAYWMFYHAGVASFLAEQEGAAFWEAAEAGLETFPRGTERRHFRGKAARETIFQLSLRYEDPLQAVYHAADSTSVPRIPTALPTKGQPLDEVMARVQQWRGFGPWIAFKVADMIDGVLGEPVDFSGAPESAFFDAPAAGAQLVYDLCADVRPTPLRHPGEINRWAVSYLLSKLGRLDCPHVPARKIAIQECETILCKFKSYRNGHYPPGKDTLEMLEGLKEWRAHSRLASHFRTVLLDIATRHYDVKVTR